MKKKMSYDIVSHLLSFCSNHALKLTYLHVQLIVEDLYNFADIHTCMGWGAAIEQKTLNTFCCIFYGLTFMKL